ncbi:MAG TPA: YfhO family protein [Phnomibacter sp.]|nr:YfhO family protein [Phnomibacter sp.]
MKVDFKKWLPHVIAIGIFLVVTLLYCKPALEGLAIEQHDLIQWKGMAADAQQYLSKNGEYPLWTNTLFGGMPTYNIAYPSNIVIPVYLVKIMGLGLPEPFLYFFLACVTFYFLSQVLRINSWIGILAALGFAYCSYDPIIIVTGHHTKMMTIAIIPALLASVLLVFEYRKYWIGGALTALFTSTVVMFNHLQMVYYTLLVMGIMAVAYAIVWIKNGEIKRLITSASVSILAGVIGVLACAVSIFTTYDYSKETMRGGKANLAPTDSLQSKAAKISSGLDVEYAFRWSYGIPETFTLIVPNAQGGVSKGLGEESHFYQAIMEKVQNRELDQNLAQQVAQFGTEYWGNQPFTSGPVYLGAIICFLFVLGMVHVKSMHKWWILAASVLGIVMAWGSNFMGFNNFLFEYLPMYNKFRAPSQSLVIPQLLFPVIGMLGLQQLLFSNEDEKEKLKSLKLAGIITAGILVLAAFFYFSADFSSGNEKEALKQIAVSNPSIAQPVKDVIKAAGEDRAGLFKNDLFRSFILIAIGFGILWVSLKQKMKPIIPVVVLLVLTAYDLLAVANRYLNAESYAEKDNTEVTNYLANSNPQLFKTLSDIKNGDTDSHYRVFNTTSDPFNDALTSAMVRSVGGYHPAKLSLYQDLIEHQLGKSNMNVYNMLDTRYFIVNTPQGLQAQQNPGALGAAWFVKNIHYVPTAAAEMQSLDSLNLKDTAIVNESFKSSIAAAPQWDSAASIQLAKYDNNEIEYAIKTVNPQFAVLSEIYYSRGWNAYADGKQVPIIKTDYALRGVAVPAGTQKLVLKFEPESYKTGSMVTNIASLLMLVVFVVGIYFERKNLTAKS